MIIALYGMPCTGKTSLLNELHQLGTIVSGSQWLNDHSQGSFSSLSQEEKKQCRIEYTKYLRSLNDKLVISDGHYAFNQEVVFTQEDGELYDVFIYLYCEPQIIHNRLQNNHKNAKFAHLSVCEIQQWQEREMSALRAQCHKRNKDFYVINDHVVNPETIAQFIQEIVKGFSSYTLAQELVEKIISWFPKDKDLYLVDGDKTFIDQDSLRFALPNYTPLMFNGDFYTGYQSFLFARATELMEIDFYKLSYITQNQVISEVLKQQNYIILSSGLTKIWEHISNMFDISHCLASPLISADTKYYVVKLLKKKGYTIRAYGDSKIDYYMLKEADHGYLYLSNQLSRSLHNTDITSLQMCYQPRCLVLNEEEHNDALMAKYIEICKSSSRIVGPDLADAHYHLGKKLGTRIREILPNKNVPVIILDRGGRFFGDGLYIGFGGQLFPLNPKKDALPKLKSNLVLIVDSVINTGQSMSKLISQLEEQNPNITVAIATNVINCDSVAKFRKHLLFAIRISQNKFVGKRQLTQVGNSGPDTADRLFNLIAN